MADPPEYSRTLVSYIDILGFAGLIEKSREDPSQIAELQDLVVAMKTIASQGGRVHRGADDQIERIFDSFNFSDLIVRSTRLVDHASVGAIVDWELFYLAEHQFFFASQGVLMRGGISMGSLFVGAEKNIVFGPALVKSYKLESEYAIFPRIVIDRDLIADAESHGYIEHFRDYIQRGEDGAYFIDYLFGVSLTDFMFSDASKAEANIEAHRRMIESVIAGDMKQRDERIKQKYLWLALYHNSAVKRLVKRREDFSGRGAFGKLADLMIPEELLNF